tara:strand:+ start:378 stop:509 length:132 start_codon:yes stop_codon:yes gene_type:complete
VIDESLNDCRCPSGRGAISRWLRNVFNGQGKPRRSLEPLPDSP